MSSILQVYFFDTSNIDSFNNYRRCLSKKEMVSYKSMISEKRKKEFVLSRYFLRSLFNINSKIEFSKSPNGKLSLSGGEKFNISHSQSFIVCAISGKYEVGIDIELSNKQNSFLAVSKKYYHDVENEYIKSSGKIADQQKNFLKLWTLKESMFKVFGLCFTKENSELYFDFTNSKIISYPGMDKNKKVSSLFIEYKNTYISVSLNSDIEIDSISFKDSYINDSSMEFKDIRSSNYKLSLFK